MTRNSAPTRDADFLGVGDSDEAIRDSADVYGSISYAANTGPGKQPNLHRAMATRWPVETLSGGGVTD